MNRRHMVVIALIFAILTLYIIFIVAQANDPVGKYVSIKGGELELVEFGRWATYQVPINDLHLAWARIHLKWNFIDELGSGSFDFSTDPDYPKYRDAVMIAKSMGAEVIITIKNAPSELIDPTPMATAPNGTPTPWPNPCGRITISQGTDRLKLFIIALLQQLRSDFGLGANDPPPVHYIEIWNEPDAAAGDAVPSVFGCWVKKDATAIPMYRNGGIYYAQVLNAIAPYVKSQFPAGSVKFVAGAAMSASNGFLEEVIDNAIDNIDVVSYHHYVFVYNNDQCDLAAYISTYDSSFSYVRNYLDSHGGSSKPILISEGAMGYDANPAPGATASPTPSPAFYDCQARFAASLLSWAKGKESNGKLLGFIWYTIDTHNWRDTGLLYSNGTPKPVYYIWRDLGPVLYIPLFYVGGTEGPQSDLMNVVVQGESSGLVGAYPLPLGNSTLDDIQANKEHDDLVNPYPAPDK